MSPTMTAFLLTFMCFASINIGVTRGVAIDLIFISDYGFETSDGTAQRFFIQRVINGSNITTEVQVGIISTEFPNDPVSNLTFWTDHEAFRVATFSINADENVRVTAALQTAANVFSSSIRAENCTTVRVLVIVARRIDDGGVNGGAFSTALRNLQDLGVITYGVLTTTANHSLLNEISQGEPARQYALNSHVELDTSGRAADLRNSFLAIPEITHCQCNPNPCKNGGTCFGTGTIHFYCLCAGDFEGVTCEFCSK